jgi:exodeoxyribonuclease VII small subunit
MKEREPEVRFEKALAELQGIVEKLERGEQDLEESLKLFERGVKLIAVCSKKLEDAARRVEIVMKERDGKKSVHPFPERGGENGLPPEGGEEEEEKEEGR